MGGRPFIFSIGAIHLKPPQKKVGTRATPLAATKMAPVAIATPPAAATRALGTSATPLAATTMAPGDIATPPAAATTALGPNATPPAAATRTPGSIPRLRPRLRLTTPSLLQGKRRRRPRCGNRADPTQKQRGGRKVRSRRWAKKLKHRRQRRGQRRARPRRFRRRSNPQHPTTTASGSESYILSHASWTNFLRVRPSTTTTPMPSAPPDGGGGGRPSAVSHPLRSIMSGIQ